MFGNGEVYKCETWRDYATGETFSGAISNNPVSGTNSGGWGDKRIFCTVGQTYTRILDQEGTDYMYMGSDLKSSSGNVCKGSTVNYWYADQRYSCLSIAELEHKYGTWTADSTGGSSPWTENNSWRKILIDQANYKWYVPCGRYYNIATPPSGKYWTGTAWADVTPPA
jgi:hypothetical protein